MDVPKVKSTDLASKLREYTGAAAAVRQGIATHAQKHRAVLHAARQKAAAALKITSGQ